MGTDEPSHERYLLGMGLELTEEFPVNDHMALSPARLDVPYHKLEDCAGSQTQYGLLVALAPFVTFQLKVRGPSAEAATIRSWNGQWFLMLLSIVTRHPVHFPIQSSRSAQEIEQAKTFISNVYFGRSIFETPRHTSVSEVTEAIQAYEAFSSMLVERRFTHACIVACNVHREPNMSVRIAALWSGIEALLGFDYELRFRIALSVAALIGGSNANERTDRFNSTKALYDQRSKCVHGSGLDGDQLQKCYVQSYHLLCELVLVFVQRGRLMSGAELTELVLG